LEGVSDQHKGKTQELQAQNEKPVELMRDEIKTKKALLRRGYNSERPNAS
jgi:hypothetical protein